MQFFVFDEMTHKSNNMGVIQFAVEVDFPSKTVHILALSTCEGEIALVKVKNIQKNSKNPEKWTYNFDGESLA